MMFDMAVEYLDTGVVQCGFGGDGLDYKLTSP